MYHVFPTFYNFIIYLSFITVILFLVFLSVTRTKSEGIVFVKFNILTKDLYTHGFDNNSRIQRINMD
jgi:hypothetical protein